MARRRKKKLSKNGRVFVLICILALLITTGLAFLFANSGNKFKADTFFIVFFSLVAAFAVISIIIAIFTPAIKGKIGESKVSSRLKKLSRKYGGYVFDNIMVPGDDNKTSQIDHIYVCEYGVFVVETKNYAGRIYGDDNQKTWTQVLAYGNSKNKLYNPVKQNKTHIIRLKELLNLSVEPESVVVFVKNNTRYITSNYVYDLRHLKRLLKNKKTVLNDVTVELIAASIRDLKLNPAKTNKEHVQEIKQMKRDIDNNICPRCGGVLVLRKGSRGFFYGCSNYPKCRFVKEVK